jgi:hypothetical protein
MSSSHYLNYIKNPQERAFLNKLRSQLNKDLHKCHICKKQSTEISCIGYRVIFLCSDHFEAGDKRIINPLNILTRETDRVNINYDFWATQTSFEE